MSGLLKFHCVEASFIRIEVSNEFGNLNIDCFVTTSSPPRVSEGIQPITLIFRVDLLGLAMLQLVSTCYLPRVLNVSLERRIFEQLALILFLCSYEISPSN